MRTTKKLLKEQILKQITAIEQNTFLFPKSWADLVQMANHDWGYKTYNSGSVGVNRYHNIEIHQEGVKILDINFRGDRIEVAQDLAEKQITIKIVAYYIAAIYDELHSFKNHNEASRKIRKQITKKLADIKDAKRDLTILRNRLTDSKKELK